jgi:hypothetical protein
MSHGPAGNRAALYLTGEPGVIQVTGKVAGLDVGLPDAGDQQGDRHAKNQQRLDLPGHPWSRMRTGVEINEYFPQRKFLRKTF